VGQAVGALVEFFVGDRALRAGDGDPLRVNAGGAGDELADVGDLGGCGIASCLLDARASARDGGATLAAKGHCNKYRLLMRGHQKVDGLA
jgi:hypothetical protein